MTAISKLAPGVKRGTPPDIETFVKLVTFDPNGKEIINSEHKAA